ncbi:GNAT family N-acetyltransferase [Streptomyces thermocarboxydus]
MWVDPMARGKGVGDYLIQAVERWAAERGATTLRLSVMADNAGRPRSTSGTFSRIRVSPAVFSPMGWAGNGSWRRAWPPLDLHARARRDRPRAQAAATRGRHSPHGHPLAAGTSAFPALWGEYAGVAGVGPSPYLAASDAPSRTACPPPTATATATVAELCAETASAASHPAPAGADPAAQWARDPIRRPPPATAARCLRPPTPVTARPQLRRPG